MRCRSSRCDVMELGSKQRAFRAYSIYPTANQVSEELLCPHAFWKVQQHPPLVENRQKSDDDNRSTWNSPMAAVHDKRRVERWKPQGQTREKKNMKRFILRLEAAPASRVWRCSNLTAAPRIQLIDWVVKVILLVRVLVRS